MELVKESNPHWLQARFCGELLLAQLPFGIGGGAVRVLLELVLVEPSGARTSWAEGRIGPDVWAR